MRKYLLITIFLSGFCYGEIKSVFIEQTTTPINVRTAIEKGLRENSSERVRRFNEKLLDLDWDDTFYDFWYPKVSLSLTASNSEMYHFATGHSRGEKQSSTGLVPNGALVLDLGEYTLYNWGIDYLGYLIEKDSYNRSKESVKEQRRDLKLNIIKQYFQLAYYKKRLKSYEDQLRHATFLYRLQRARFTNRKLSKIDYYRARTEYLEAKNNIEAIRVEVSAQDAALAELISDNPTTIYRITEDLKFIKHKYPLEDAIAKAMEYNDTLNDLEVTMRNAERSHEATVKGHLPLPKLTVNLGAYTHGFDKDGGTTTFETNTGDTNVELVGSINATWTLFGSGGFLNAREREKAIVTKKLAHYNYHNQKRSLELSIRTAYQNIKLLEAQMVAAQATAENAQKYFDAALDEFSKSKVSFSIIRRAMLDLLSAEIAYEEAKYNHLQERISLAQSIGIDDFPGSSFENLGSTQGTQL